MATDIWSVPYKLRQNRLTLALQSTMKVYRKGMEPVRKLKVVAPSLPKRKMKPAESLEEEENQMISLAMSLAKERMMNGTASSQEIVHFLRLGSTRERLEREILERQKEQIEAKTDNLRSSATSEELYSRAISAMRHYQGSQDDDEDYSAYIR